MSAEQPLVLGIETSCDETGVGIVRGTTLLADAVASSVDEHARFGGVVPEVASRAHLEAMVPTLERAAETAGVRLHDVDAVAVTSGPGLAGTLLVGIVFLGWSLRSAPGSPSMASTGRETSSSANQRSWSWRAGSQPMSVVDSSSTTSTPSSTR